MTSLCIRSLRDRNRCSVVAKAEIGMRREVVDMDLLGNR
jgi:hypothetical protein